MKVISCWEYILKLTEIGDDDDDDDDDVVKRWMLDKNQIFIPSDATNVRMMPLS